MLERVPFLFRRQIHEIGKGGWRVVWNTALTILGLFFAPVFVLIARMLRPFVLIRFGKLISVRIGHFAINTEVYLCEKDAGLHDEKAIDIFYHSQAVCNYHLKNMWDRILYVSPLAGAADALSRRLPGWRPHVIPMRDLFGDKDIHRVIPRTKPHLSFSAREENLGRQGLCNMGIPSHALYVCFSARDSAYLEQTTLTITNWRYHDYRDSDISCLVPGIEALTRRGYYALRMGAVVKNPLEIANPLIIDYATKYRSEFLDIYLLSKCRFFIGDTAGIFCVPLAFRRPVVLTNWIPLGHFPDWGEGNIFIPKKLWSNKLGRLLGFREIMASEIALFYDTKKYEEAGLRIVENTAEEITAAVVEMDERLNGTWKAESEDEELQARFWSLLDDLRPDSPFPMRVSACFLRNNRHLLA